MNRTFSHRFNLWAFLALLLCTSSLYGQSGDDAYVINFKSMTYLPFATTSFTKGKVASQKAINGNYYLLMQFNTLPTFMQVEGLKKDGVELLTYYGANAYLATVSSDLIGSNFNKWGVRSLDELPLDAKMSLELLNGDYPDWSLNVSGYIDVTVLKQKDIVFDNALSNLRSSNFEILNEELERFNMVDVRLPIAQMEDLAAENWVEYLQPIEAPLVSFNHKNPQTTRSSSVRSKYNGEAGLSGEGVVVGVGDGGKVFGHIDTEDRINNQTNIYYSSWGAHAFCVTGIIGGAGNLNPWHRGIASSVELITQATSLILQNADSYHQDFGMTLTNNSYGPSSFQCSTTGIYNSSSALVDNSLIGNDEFVHVFAAGNSGDDGCTIYPAPYGTVVRSYASSKNGITVGSIEHRGGLMDFSSCGPTADGRIKPELVTPGWSVLSTSMNNEYIGLHGTSMSAASVTGDLALLSELYSNLNGGDVPRGDLLKAVALNSATDRGNKGPDYAFGFGIPNTNRAAKAIKNGTYFRGSISEGDEAVHTISVPSSIYEVKAMLYWHDPVGSLSASKSLVNDLDFELIDPDNNIVLPWVLDHTPSNVDAPAERMEDHVNNVEQITLEGSEIAPGTYTLKVKGTEIPVGVQDYVIVYSLVKPGVEITYPAGGETFIPGFKNEDIRWDAVGPGKENIVIEYSLDNGNSWVNIPVTARGAELGFATWKPAANLYSSIARIRATIPGVVVHSDVNDIPFKIIGFPQNLTTELICADEMKLSWSPVPNAVSYEVMKKDVYMEVIGRTTMTDFLVSGLSTSDEEWFTVRPIMDDGAKGMPAVAVSSTSSGTGVCPSISDVGVAQIVSPIKNGREYTSLSLDLQAVTIELSNYGNTTVSNFPVEYQINGEPVVSEIFTGSIAAGESMTYTFTTPPLSMLNVGTYSVKAWTTMPGDAGNQNDEAEEVVVKQLANHPVGTSDFPIVENFDSFGSDVLLENSIGMPGLDALDFMTSDLGGRLRVGSDFSPLQSGYSNGLTLDATYPIVEEVTNEMVFTYNLSAVASTLSELELNFDYAQHDQDSNPKNRVYVRGSDTDTWLELYNLDAGKTVSGIFQSAIELDILTVLAAANQSLSSSFQVKFSQAGSTSFNNPLEQDGFTFDNIRLDDGSVLPVELAFFEVEKRGMDGILKWATYSELNNNYFEVQYADEPEKGNELDFKLMGQVRGAGTTTEPQFYQFIDTDKEKKRKRYYRLKQVDFDGTVSYSDVKILNFEVEGSLSLEVFPNPTFGEVNVEIYSELDGPYLIKITDITGKLIDVVERSGVKGEILLEQFTLGAKYPEGYYIIHANVGAITQSFKVLKMAEQ